MSEQQSMGKDRDQAQYQETNRNQPLPEHQRVQTAAG